MLSAHRRFCDCSIQATADIHLFRGDTEPALRLLQEALSLTLLWQPWQCHDMAQCSVECGGNWAIEVMEVVSLCRDSGDIEDSSGCRLLMSDT